MNALYEYGKAQAEAGYPWQKLPPGFESTLAHPARAAGGADSAPGSAPAAHEAKPAE